jgi:protein phosphatase
MPVRHRDIRLRSSARTNVGRVRDNNEDNVHLWSRSEFVLAVVADGMGGAVAGEIASRVAVDTIEEKLVVPEYNNRAYLENISDDEIATRLRDAVSDANLSIVRRVATDPQLRGMGTTMTLAFMRGGDTMVAHVGDSRAYLIDQTARMITQVTADHSFAQALVDAGHLTREQAEEHPMGNVLYRALGQGEDLDIDVYEMTLKVGDRLLLCTDGLTRHVKPVEIGEIVLRYSDPDKAAEALIELANERGGEDNVSVVIILVEAADPNARPDAPELDESTVELHPPNLADEGTLRLKRENEPPLIAGDADDTLLPRPPRKSE